MAMDGRVIDPKDFKPDQQRLTAIRDMVFGRNENPEGNATITHCLNHIAYLERLVSHKDRLLDLLGGDD